MITAGSAHAVVRSQSGGVRPTSFSSEAIGPNCGLYMKRHTVAMAMTDTAEMEANVARVRAERPRLAAAMAEVGWDPQPSVTNFILLDLVTAERSEAAALALMQRGLVPRTFGHGHPLAHCIRVTVRDPHEDDRLIEAAHEISPTLPPIAARTPETAA